MSRDLGREASRQLLRAVAAGPRGEPRGLLGQRDGIVEIECLQLALHGDVVVEHLGEHRRMGGATKRAEQRREVRGLAILACERELVRQG